MRAAGLITAKFAQEGACWVEFDSDGFERSGAKMDMTISENRLPGEVHNLHPSAHNGTYRLEPNNQLYEGIRYVFINVTSVGKGRCFLVFVQLFEKYGTLIERNTALIEKVSPFIAATGEGRRARSRTSTSGNASSVWSAASAGMLKPCPVVSVSSGVNSDR